MEETDPIEQSREEANRILAVAGWHSHPDWEPGQFARANLVGGIRPDGLGCDFKDWTKVGPDHPLHGPDTPDTPAEAAQWLVNLRSKQHRFRRKHREANQTLVEKGEQRKNVSHDKAAPDLPQVWKTSRPDPDDQRAAVSPLILSPVLRDVHEGAEAEAPGVTGSGKDAGEHEGLQPHAFEAGGPDGGAVPDVWGREGADASPGLLEPEIGGVDVPPLPSGASQLGEADSAAEGTALDSHLWEDADFERVEPDGAEAAGEIEGAEADWPSLGHELGEELQDPVNTGVDPGGVAYFGDNLHVIRLAKIGRVTQIAYERKAELQTGWTLDRFAFLQNLVVRIDRGEAPDDPSAKAEFEAIGERSRAMSRVDAHAGVQVAFLETASREEVEDYDPEAGWP